MTAAAEPRPPRTRFFSRSALLMLAMVLSSFPITYFVPIASGSGHFSPVYHIHGAAFFGWILLYAWQTHLVAAGRVARHREFGLAGIALSAVMLPLGVILMVAAIRRRIGLGDPFPFDYALFNLVDIASFTMAMTASIAAVTRHVDWHRRFTFVAALCLVGPACSRWFYAMGLPALPPFSDFAASIIADCFLIALALHDRRTLGRIHPVTLWAAVVLVPIHLLTPFATGSASWRAVAPGLLHLMG